MRIVESSDGEVKVVELDPTKWYWVIGDHSADIRWERVHWRNGQIILKHAGTEVQFIEHADRITLDNHPVEEVPHV